MSHNERKHEAAYLEAQEDDKTGPEKIREAIEKLGGTTPTVEGWA